MQPEFDAHKTLEEAHERAEHGREGGTRRILLIAAVFAVIAAILSLFANQRATLALQEKNDAILAQAKASDAWNFYQARSIKSKIYDATSTLPSLSDAARKKLTAAAKHESRDQKKLQDEATEYQKQVTEHAERSERLMHSHEILEAAVTFFEVAIAIVSIAGMTASGPLVVLGVLAAVAGTGLAVFGFLPQTVH